MSLLSGEYNQRAKGGGFGKTLKRAFCTAAGAYISALGLSATLMQAPSLISRDLEDHVTRAGYDARLFEDQRGGNIKVYKDTPLTAFHSAPFLANNMTIAAAEELLWETTGDKILNSTLLGVFWFLNYHKLLYDHLTDETSDHLLAYTYLPALPNGACFIKTPHDASLSDAVYALAHIPPQKGKRIASGDDRKLGSLLVLLHEVRHYKTDYFSTIEGEIKADLNIVDKIGGGETARLLLHARAAGAFAAGQFNHATALALDAHSNGKPMPDPLSIYYANSLLYLAWMNKTGPYAVPDHSSLYPVFREILAEEHNAVLDAYPILKPLARRAAELYVEGLEYLAPSIVEEFNNRPVRPAPPALPILIPGV